jgi:hypothetical protein
MPRQLKRGGGGSDEPRPRSRSGGRPRRSRRGDGGDDEGRDGGGYPLNDHIRGKAADYMRRFPEVTHLSLTPSTAAGKRLTARFVMDGEERRVHFGLYGATTWADGADANKRKGYQARASKITDRYGRYTFNVPGTANSFAYWILW